MDYGVMLKRLNIYLVLGLLVMSSCGRTSLPEMVEAEYVNLPETIDFNQDIKPILSDKCYLCHGPDENKIAAGLQLHLPELAFAELPETPGKYAIKPRNLSKSEVFHRIISEDPNYLMPNPESHLSLSNYEKAVLIKWIEDGAEYKDHWAFVKPETYSLPETSFAEHINNPIDHFVLATLEKHQLEPSIKADKETLLRRVSFDLTGLPPTLEDMNSFLADTTSTAFEKQVNRLLASPHYGEHMALGWMDLSRFADTHGYSVDRYRDMSPWRDWVIESFNNNMPYDQFVTWQLAGDLLENPTRDMKLATAFNRIHPQNMEGGIVNEEFLIEYAVDRVSTVSSAFMGLTVACARCHDHKFDPISQKNFYELTSYFNNINEIGQISFNNAMPVPTLLLTTEEEDQMIAYMNRLMQDSEQNIKKIREEVETSDFKAWLDQGKYKHLLKTPIRNNLVAHFDLDDKRLRNRISPFQKGTMKRESAEGQNIDLVDGKYKKGVMFNGDTWLDLKQTAVFGRSDAFSISFWAHIPSDIKNGNIFHKGIGAILYGWRGYHLKIVENKLELMMAHTAPDNAITKITESDFPRDEWIHMSVTYDGSSKASGYSLYINGKEIETKVKTDNLYKDILFRNGSEPGLQFGARLRGKGIKGAIVDDIRVYNRVLSDIEILKLSESENFKTMLAKSSADLIPDEKDQLKQYYSQVVSKKANTELRRLAKLRKAYADSVEALQEVMVMKETQQPVQAYLLERGVYDAKGEKVFPNTPENVLPMPKDYEANRLGFSKWLFHEDHPLTARVAVNRLWQQFFGRGLVKTSEDFGNQGEMPSHPKLLDWLALEFKNSGWDIKALQKKIVLSNAYQQSSVTGPGTLEQDIENKFLARGPSKRLSGEMLRDNALLASGLLNKNIGGKSVKPYQPEGLWKVNGISYNEDRGDNLYRRSLYTIWKRSVPHPTLATFDAPDRSACTIRRQETNTPLQALVILNDPTYIEAARVLGKNMLSFKDHKKAISDTFRKLTGRTITSDELNLLLRLRDETYKDFGENLSKTKGWLNTGAFRVALNDDKAMVAANAVVASTIMNSDATITKR